MAYLGSCPGRTEICNLSTGYRQLRQRQDNAILKHVKEGLQGQQELCTHFPNDKIQMKVGKIKSL